MDESLRTKFEHNNLLLLDMIEIINEKADPNSKDNNCKPPPVEYLKHGSLWCCAAAQVDQGCEGNQAHHIGGQAAHY